LKGTRSSDQANHWISEQLEAGMATDRVQSGQLEREVDQTRGQLSETLEELLPRITPGHVVDQLIDYGRGGSAAEFLRNLAREIRQHPLPVVLTGIGIAWLMVASSRSSRR